ncbi:MAG: MoaD/ThiS family protein [Phycisphaerales bacterium]|jgi:molybdopterin converting factor subunit 1|nr:MoaD/ThiS family protein [Phycisphaerales bacterium]
MNWSDGLAENDITITVLFFAAAADAAGCREHSMVLPAGTTAREAVDAVVAEKPGLSEIRESCAVAIDRRVVGGDAELAAGCTLAVLPPVSGG